MTIRSHFLRPLKRDFPEWHLVFADQVIRELVTIFSKHYYRSLCHDPEYKQVSWRAKAGADGNS